MPTQIQLSPSRIVEGNVYKSSNLGMNGQVLAKPKFYFGVAIAKNDPRLGEIWGAYQAEAQASYANNRAILERIARGLAPNTGFAWKISDGDAPERREKPGQAGCWIFKFTTTWEIKVVDQNNQPINPQLLRTGFYCDVLANLAGNGKTDHTAGLYANPVFVRWLFPGYGEEIQPGPQADKVMGAAPTQLPPGATLAAGGTYAGVSAPGGFPGGGVSPSVPGMGGGAGQAPGAQAHHVGHQAPAAQASYTPPAGFGGQGAGNPPINHVNASMPGNTSHQMNTGTPGQSAIGAQPGGQSNPTPAPGGQGTVNPMHVQIAAGMSGGMPSTGPGVATASPSNVGNGPAGAPAAMGAAMPAGAHYTPAQPGSPTASHSNTSVPGFAHGNPQ